MSGAIVTNYRYFDASGIAHDIGSLISSNANDGLQANFNLLNEFVIGNRRITDASNTVIGLNGNHITNSNTLEYYIYKAVNDISLVKQDISNLKITIGTPSINGVNPSGLFKLFARTPIIIITTNYDISPSSLSINQVIVLQLSLQTYSVNLPLPLNCIGQVLFISNYSNNSVIIKCTNSVNNSTSYFINSNQTNSITISAFEFKTIISDGTYWVVMA
jgi:hypothetical protein